MSELYRKLKNLNLKKQIKIISRGECTDAELMKGTRETSFCRRKYEDYKDGKQNPKYLKNIWHFKGGKSKRSRKTRRKTRRR